MIQDRTIICIANRWDYDPTSKHHVMKALARSNQVVWVNYRGSRRPRASARDALAILATLKAALAGPRRVSDSMVQLTPVVIPGALPARLQAANQALLVAQIRRALKRLPQRPVQLWTFAPDVSFLAGRFDEECLVYYCVDEFAAFEDHDSRAIRTAERRLIDRADVVITTSQTLYESRRAQHPNTFLVRHGVDFAHFASAVDGTLPVPQDLADIPRPVFGFFGLMHHWFDVELLAAVARARPDKSFVLIGDSHTEVSALKELPNVHLLGRRDYRDLPAYCAAFDAALLPFRINRMTRNINPIKLREYLAAGLPVIATPLPEAAVYQPDVLIAKDAISFARCCSQALTMTSPDARRRRSARVADESWTTVVERLSKIVTGVVEGRVTGQGAAEPQQHIDELQPIAIGT